MANNDIEIFDDSLLPLGILQGVSEYQYELENTGIGSFIFSCLISASNLSMIKKRYFVLFEGNNKAIFIIENFKKIKNEDGRIEFVVRGRSALAILGLRIIWDTYNCYNKRVGYVVNQMITSNVISPSDTDRVISFVTINSGNINIGPYITMQTTGQNLLTKILDTCAANDISFYCEINRSTNKINYVVKNNVDHRESSASPVVYTSDMESIISSEYLYNETFYSNSALVAGAGEGELRKKKEISEGIGSARREVFIDARDLAETDSDGLPIPEPDYLLMLEERGKEKLADFKAVENFNAELDIFSDQFIFDTDFSIGDYITIVDKDLDVQQDVQVTSYRKTVNSSQERLEFIFGEAQPSIYTLTRRRWNVY